jgi:hypothetical protein
MHCNQVVTANENVTNKGQCEHHYTVKVAIARRPNDQHASASQQ